VKVRDSARIVKILVSALTVKSRPSGVMSEPETLDPSKATSVTVPKLIPASAAASAMI
jgi:hypothetical protein